MANHMGLNPSDTLCLHTKLKSLNNTTPMHTQLASAVNPALISMWHVNTHVLHTTARLAGARRGMLAQRPPSSCQTL